MRQPRGATTADEPSVDWEAGGQWLGPFSASQGKVQRGSLLARGAWRPGVLGEQPPTLSLPVATTVFGWRRPPPLGYSLYAIKLQDAQAADLAYTAQVSDAVTRKADDIHDTRIPCGNTMTIHVGMVRYE